MLSGCGLRLSLLQYCVAPSPAPPLTLDNVLKAVEGVKVWKPLGNWGFGVNTDSIKHQHDSDEACLKAVVEKFLLGEGDLQPSWRAVIYSLDMAVEVQLADNIRSFGEPVQGECTCTIVFYAKLKACKGEGRVWMQMF